VRPGIDTAGIGVKRKANLILWPLFGAVVAALGAGLFRAYVIVKSGYSLDAVPPLTMAIKVMELHLWALYGAIAGAVIAVCGNLYALLRGSADTDFIAPEYADSFTDGDTKIRELRAQRAEQYLASRTDPGLPSVENVITARGGMFTYRVMAHRYLSEQERMDAVREALAEGRLQEPESGGSATLITDIGKGSGQN